jgi:hypothetical protein
MHSLIKTCARTAVAAVVAAAPLMSTTTVAASVTLKDVYITNQTLSSGSGGNRPTSNDSASSKKAQPVATPSPATGLTSGSPYMVRAHRL